MKMIGVTNNGTNKTNPITSKPCVSVVMWKSLVYDICLYNGMDEADASGYIN